MTPSTPPSGDEPAPLCRPAAVSFDVGGTLIVPWPSVGHAYATVAARFGAGRIDPDLLNRRFSEAWARRGREFRYGESDWQTLVARVFDGVSEVGGDNDFFKALYEHFATATPWRVFPDVEPTLTGLRDRGIKLAVVSNWDDRLRPLLTALDLDRHFDTILVSAEEGVQKPDPAIFRETARRLEVSPAKVVHIGDSTREDVAGARAAGMQAVRVDRAREQDGEHDLLRQCRLWLFSSSRLNRAAQGSRFSLQAVAPGNASA
ncbi:MAG: HAD-IA family hydrolase [Verrucomicrobiales bacterium]|nr:HAD-IA family hydrolase [Verrucomicrobiales bacterium]